MNKKIKLISICIIFLLCVIGHIYNTNNTNNTNNNISLQDNNVTYAISLDGKKLLHFLPGVVIKCKLNAIML